MSLLPLLAQWILVANHTHSAASVDSGLQVAHLARAAEARGVQAVVLTDHNSVAGVLDPFFKATGSVTLIEGEEWGDIIGPRFIGHIGMIGLQGDTAVDPSLPLEEALAQARARGALSVVNHPFNTMIDFHYPEIPDGAGVEVWNQPWNTWPVGNPQALAWWDRALRAGRRSVAVGGSDIHGWDVLGAALTADTIDRPVNLVLAEDASADQIVRAFHAGRVMISRDTAGPRLDLRVGEVGIGDEIPAGAPATASVTVSGGSGRVLSLHMRAGKVFEKVLAEGEEAIDVPVTPAADHDFVRVELRETTGWPEPEMAAMTNPVYFR